VNSALLGALAALSWGSHDFLARFPSRAVGPVTTVLFVTLTGLVLVSGWLLISGAEVRFSWPSLWLVAIAGSFYALATLCLFAALAIGPLSIVAPIAGSYPALAVLFALTQGARPGLVAWLAIVAVSVGVVVVSRSGGRFESTGDIAPGKLPAILLLSLGASFGFAIGLTAGQAAVPIFGEVATAWLGRMFGLATVLLIWLALPKRSLPLRWLPVLTLMGGLDITALLLIVAAGSLADPELATVASSAFGAVAVVWARLLLKEPIAPMQLLGIALVFCGVAVLAANPQS
jgi:drug/metabolite transporter (DMT)-like permease